MQSGQTSPHCNGDKSQSKGQGSVAVPPSVAAPSRLHLRPTAQLSPCLFSLLPSSLSQRVISLHCSQGRMPLPARLAERSSYASGHFVLFSNANFLRFDLCACFFPPSISKMTENIGKEAALWLMLASHNETMPGSGYSTQNSPPQLARTGMPAASACRDASTEWSMESEQLLFH